MSIQSFGITSCKFVRNLYLNKFIRITGMSPLIMSDMKYCSIKKSDKVSPWNLHSAIEVNGLLDMQTSLWSLSKQCVTGLSRYLCFPATLCYRNEAGNLLKKYNGLCKEAIQSWFVYLFINALIIHHFYFQWERLVSIIVLCWISTMVHVHAPNCHIII